MRAAFVMAAAVVLSPAHAFDTGNQLKDALDSNKPLAALFIRGWIAGTLGGYAYSVTVLGRDSENPAIMKDALTFCLPDGITGLQLADVTLAYLNANPATRHEVSGSLLRRAMRQAFPCK